MTIEQFSNYSPDPGSISLYFSASVVSGVNVSNIDCSGNNVADSLQELTNLIVNINDVNYTLEIISGIPKDAYYFYNIEPVTVTSLVDQVCSDSQLVPQPGRGRFEVSEYNATRNNVTYNTSTGFIFDVDRTQLSTTPVNYGSIISGSATPAEFQELNYTSVGLTNSRYEGSKTTRSTYGTEPSINLSTFEGILYNTNIQDSDICSQSLEQSDITLLGMTSEYNRSKVPSDGFPTFVKNSNQFSFSGYISGSSTTPASLKSNIDTIQVDWRRTEISKLQVDGLYHFTTEPTEEFFILKSFELTGQKVVGGTGFNTYTLKVERGAGTKTFDHTATNTSDYNINIKKVESDQVFEFNGNKVSTLSNKKIYLPTKSTIVVTGKEGMVYSGSIPC